MQVLLHHGLASWTQANSGIITPEEIKRESGREIEIEKGTVTVTGSESVPGTGSESVTIAPLLVCSTGELNLMLNFLSPVPFLEAHVSF